MTQLLEKFLRKRKQAKNYPAKYQDVFDSNQLDLMQYIKSVEHFQAITYLQPSCRLLHVDLEPESMFSVHVVCQ